MLGHGNNSHFLHSCQHNWQKTISNISNVLNRCLDKAATRRANQAPGTEDRWLFTVTQVEEVKRMAGFVPIMIATIIFNTGAPNTP